MNVVTAVQHSRMSIWQYVVVGICFLGNMADGFELAVIGFALPRLPDGYATTGEKGWLASGALIGMGIGAMFLTKYADTYGRRRVLIAASATSTVGMTLSAMAPNVWTMFGLRVLTGLGVGVIGALTIIVAQEYSSLKNRNMSTAMTTIGYATGAFLAGSLGLVLFEALGGAWQSLFVTGAVISLIGTVAMFFLLPESLEYLMARNDEKSRAEIMRIAARLNLAGVDPYAKPVISGGATTADAGAGKVTPFSKPYRSTTLKMTFGFTMVIAAYYFVTNWTPQLITDATGDEQTGTLVGTMVTFGAVIGAVVFGILGMKLFSTHVAWIMLLVAVIAQLTFALTMEGTVAIVAAGLLGLGGFAAMSSYMASAPPLFPAFLRGRAVGAIVGLSRTGSIITPIAAGYLLSYVSGFTLYVGASMLFAISGVTIFLIWRSTRDQFAKERDSGAAVVAGERLAGVASPGE
ncbi:MFS transporter [Gordonia sp. LSe1-13]|uniref:MFS transporter n=1 Tax=Gordonia sesuvii TaxID=3116777 RepID=A0ABU7MIQ6_9ACTN|nr:MFS transporter [Gordonia sp. LSe1-13]